MIEKTMFGAFLLAITLVILLGILPPVADLGPGELSAPQGPF